MSHNFVQQLIHVIWSTENQQFKIPLTTRNELYAYLSTAIKDQQGKLYYAGGHCDHVHCLLSLPPTISVSDMMRKVKTGTSQWIKNKDNIGPKFSWENGFTVISLQQDRVDPVCSYIKGDEKRHDKMTYREELSNILKLQNISYNKEYFIRNSHSKILLHLIWSTKNRIPLLEKAIRPSLHQQMCATASENESIVHAIGGVEDHVHLLLEISRKTALSDLVKDIKVKATHWLSTKCQSFNDFEWQGGYGGFTISLPTLDIVKQYIMRQEEHHKVITSTSEWNEFVFKKGVI
jgi:REP element-mobilizing transposase RayT